MAIRTTKDMIRDVLVTKLPERSKCTPEVANLLQQLNQVASEFHRRITLPYWSVQTRTQQLAFVSHPDYLEAERQVRGLMARLKEPYKVNLCGIGTTMEFCEAFIGAYKIKYPG
ncbi:MAG: hypothetical protein ACYC44_00865 [Patescibacteria group bacterium]